MSSTRETYANDTTTFLNTTGSRNQSRGGTQIRGGFDYYLSEKTSVTVSSEVGRFDFSSFGSGHLHNYDNPSSFGIYSVQNTNSGRSGNFVSANASFLTKFDDMGVHRLEGSFNYRNRDGRNNETNDEYRSDDSYEQKNEYLSQVITSENSNSDNYRAKLDYTLPLKGGDKFEAGLQSRIENEREELKFSNFGVNDPKFTSDMDFKEDIHALYSTYTGNLKAIKYVLGIRGEYNKRSITHYKDNVAYPHGLDRLDFFPSAHLSYELADKSQLMTSYSRRINRPDGRDLDPFPTYMNQYSILIGNPDLKPEYTDSYEFSYMKRFGASFVSLETFYRTTNNLMTRLTTVTDGISYMTSDNLNRDYSLGGELMGNINMTKWLLVNASFTVYNYRLKGEVLGKSVDRESTNYSGRMNATIKFSPDSRLQITGFYRGPSVSAQSDQKGLLYSNLSFRQELMKKKLSATLSVRDVFGTMKMQGTSYGENFRSTFKNVREPRVLMLTLSYKINNYKIDRQAPAEEPGPGTEDMF